MNLRAVVIFLVQGHMGHEALPRLRRTKFNFFPFTFWCGHKKLIITYMVVFLLPRAGYNQGRGADLWKGLRTVVKRIRGTLCQ